MLTTDKQPMQGEMQSLKLASSPNIELFFECTKMSNQKFQKENFEKENASEIRQLD